MNHSITGDWNYYNMIASFPPTILGWPHIDMICPAHSEYIVCLLAIQMYSGLDRIAKFAS